MESYFKSILFRYYKVGPFNPSSSFSTVTPLLAEAHKSHLTGKVVGLFFNDLFDVSTSKFTTGMTATIDELVATVKFKSPITEASFIKKLIVNLMLPMFGRVTVERNKKYGTLPEGVESIHIGMGTEATWHGSPDFRIRCVCMLGTGGAGEYIFCGTETSQSYVGHSPILSTPIASTSTPIASTSNVSTLSGSSPFLPTLSLTNLEGKKHIQNKDRDQLVATCVVSSFINYNVNGRNMTPAVLINGTTFIVSLYNVSNDVLLLSNAIVYNQEEQGLFPPGLLALAIVIHHQATLLRTSNESQYPSGIVSQLITLERLKDFRALNSHNIDTSSFEMSLTELNYFGSDVERVTCGQEREQEKQQEDEKNGGQEESDGEQG